MRTLALRALAMLALLAIACGAGGGSTKGAKPTSSLRSGMGKKGSARAQEAESLACGNLGKLVCKTTTRPRSGTASLHVNNLRVQGETIR